jgi:osmoprotectant transport system ATP-binding protein
MAIELLNLTKKYGDLTAVDDVSLTFRDRELSVLIGPSGCGKTTLLRTMNRLLDITSGDIKYDGTSIRDIPPIELRRSIGYVIQEIGLFPHMTVFENIAVVPRLLKWEESKIERRVKELVELVNLDPDEYTYKYPAQLSGGQRQRVGVARGLGADPKILLMDEPFGAIDPINREVLQDSFLEIQKEIKKTVVFVTHDIREAVKLADRVAILRQGRLVQYDEVMQVLNNPKNEFVEDLMGADRALKGLELLRVEQSYSSEFFAIDTSEVDTAGKAAKTLREHERSFAFVVDGKGTLAGYVLLNDAERASADAGLEGILKTAESIQPESTVMEAITRMVTTGITSAAVVNGKNKLLGVMRFRDVFDRVESMADTGEG